MMSHFSAERSAPFILQMYLVALTSAVGFISVLIGRALHLDYSAKLFVMTFVLVVMAAEHSTGATPPTRTDTA